VPQARRPGQTTIQRSQNGTSGAPNAQLDTQEAAVIRAAIGAKEQAPSSRVASVFENWRAVADQLGDPFEKERIPLSKLRQMRRDPMLGFGLSFIQTPHVRARWHIKAIGGQNPEQAAQVAAHADENWRASTARYVAQFMNSLIFGFQAIAKRFEFRIPSGTYVTTSDAGENSGAADLVRGRSPTDRVEALRRSATRRRRAVWDKGTGEFFGIEYTPNGASSGSGQSQGGGAPGGTGASQTSWRRWRTTRSSLQDRPRSLALDHQREGRQLRLDLRLSPARLRLLVLVELLVPLGHRRSRLRAQGRSFGPDLPPGRRVHQRGHRRAMSHAEYASSWASGCVLAASSRCPPRSTRMPTGAARSASGRSTSRRTPRTSTPSTRASSTSTCRSSAHSSSPSRRSWRARAAPPPATWPTRWVSRS
jgi:hypothetical protein